MLYCVYKVILLSLDQQCVWALGVFVVAAAHSAWCLTEAYVTSEIAISTLLYRNRHMSRLYKPLIVGGTTIIGYVCVIECMSRLPRHTLISSIQNQYHFEDMAVVLCGGVL